MHRSAKRVTPLSRKPAAILLIILLHVAAAPAQVQRTAPPDAAFSLAKGSVEIGAIGGLTLPVSWLRAHADRHIAMGSIDIGRIMTGEIGGGPLAGNFELLLEFTPFFLVQQPAHTFGFTISPLHMRWNFASRRRARVFAEASGGIVYTGQPVPPRTTTTLNFIDQAGFGVRIAETPRRAWMIGYRFQHISNAGRVEPNPGANFNLVYGGVMFRR